jgi:hypothetical protein
MAHGTLCRMRFYHVNDRHPQLNAMAHYQQLKNEGYNRNLTLVEITYTAAFANGLTQTSIPNAVFDGSAGAKVVYVASDHADDTDNAVKAVRAVTVLGVTASGLEKDVIRMAGLTAVAGVKLFYRVFHFYASEWGSGGSDAAGNIILSSADPAGAHDDCLRIAAAANESEGAAFWVPTDYLIAFDMFELVPITSASALESIQMQIKYTYCDGDTDDPELNYDMIESNYASSKATYTSPKMRLVTGATAPTYAKVDVYDSYKGAASSGFARLLFLVVGYSSALRGVT